MANPLVLHIPRLGLYFPNLNHTAVHNAFNKGYKKLCEYVSQHFSPWGKFDNPTDKNMDCVVLIVCS